jgi:S-adenosylmethionine:tRNA ribosyltransferase-isomerase
MDLSLFDYELPEELIAQFPAENRDESKLLVVNRKDGLVNHKHFYDILDYINPDDCLVLNNSKVIHARLIGIKEKTGATIEIFLIKKVKDGEDSIWEAMVKPAKRLKKGDIVAFSHDFKCELIGEKDDGLRMIKFDYSGIFMERLAELGKMPLPPYIKRQADEKDDGRYQTVYSEIEGSVAAPTAGLHFTEELLAKVQDKGVKIAYLTLHVGIGTFRPVKVETIENHTMHDETYSVSQETAYTINSTRESGGRIICVGTTSVRTIESVADDEGVIHSGEGSTDIFIYPGYKFKAVDSLITNFHLPKSTLMMLISAFYDREKVLDAYKIAIDKSYRFFSYGDSMLLL